VAALADTPDENPTEENGSAGRSWSPGRRLGGRYRLERRVRGFGGGHSPEPQLWVGVDELLNRKVGVDLIAADHPLLEEVARAARDAAAVADARFVQVLDAVRDEDLLYIVTEWVPGAEQLGERLQEGPLSPARATSMIREAAEAMVRAHEAEVAHGALNPATVLITATGQVKLRGLLVEATLSGCSPQALGPEARYAADVLALGRIWYAALTALWPEQEGELPLEPAPRDESDAWPYSPAQIRAAVPKQVDTAVSRALGIGDPESAPAITTVKELADVIRSLPRLHDETAEPTSVLPRSRSRAAAPTTVIASAGRPEPPRDTTPPWSPAPSAPGGGAFWRRRGVLAVAGCAALALATLAAFQFAGGNGGTAAAQSTGTGGTPSVGTVTIPAGTVGSQLGIGGATVWDESPSQSSIKAAKSAFDPSSTGGWKTTTQLQSASFNGSYAGGSGIGLIFDLSGSHEVDEVKFQVPFSGGTVEVLTASASAAASPAWSSGSGPAGYSVQGTKSQPAAGSDIVVKFAPVTTRYVMILFTALPYEPAVDSTGTPAGYRDGLIDVRVYGA
jgi:hypothetical protein